jgi:hypothetical protein
VKIVIVRLSGYEVIKKRVRCFAKAAKLELIHECHSPWSGEIWNGALESAPNRQPGKAALHRHPTSAATLLVALSVSKAPGTCRKTRLSNGVDLS